MIIYCVAYATFLDDTKFFLDRGEADKCLLWTRRRMKLDKTDQMLRVVELEVYERFDAKRYEGGDGR